MKSPTKLKYQIQVNCINMNIPQFTAEGSLNGSFGFYSEQSNYENSTSDILELALKKGEAQCGGDPPTGQYWCKCKFSCRMCTISQTCSCPDDYAYCSSSLSSRILF